MIEYGEPYRAYDILDQHRYGAMAASAVILFAGIGFGLLYYAPKGFPYFVPTRLSAARTAARLGGIYSFLVHKWYFDELYNAVFVQPCLYLARFCHQIDKILIDGLVDGSAADDGTFEQAGRRLRRDRRRFAREFDRQGRVCRGRLEPLDPDGPAAQLPDVPGARPGRPVRRSLSLDSKLDRRA